MSREPIALKRVVDAIQIPYGEPLKLPAGSQVTIHQVLGGNFTVVTDSGIMARIDSWDADALGEAGKLAQAEAAPAAPAKTDPNQPITGEGVVKSVWDQLKTCYDPEIPVNVVELGLVYEVKVEPHPSGEGYSVDVKMTLTAPGCGMGPVLQMDAVAKLNAIPGVKRANVEIVFDPPWDREMMSDAAKLQLGMM
jgi:probable FeS assembly SUF system protein SufT